MIMLSRRQVVSALALAGVVPWARAADGLELLGRFLQQVRSGRAQFTQVVTSPARGGQAPRSKSSSGQLEFQRPGRFRFVYRKPFEQMLLADGQTLWLHDVDLQQVTARRQSEVLGATPAALLTTAADLRSLQADFNFEAQGTREGLQWVRATPRGTEGQVRWLQAGLRPIGAAAELVMLEIEDSLGQRTVLRLSAIETNPSLPSETFVFRPPAGVDVIRS
jgi:outer membrane lipoprotein carrier protein